MASENKTTSKNVRVIRSYYLFQFFFTLLFWTPIFFEYQKRMGLSDPENFRVQSIYYAVFCLFEIPTGYFADRFGYVRSMKLGAILLVASNLCAIYATTFTGFTVHWILIAGARSFVSGASSAYLYEYLRRSSSEAGETVVSRPEEFKQIEGNSRAYSLFGRVLCFAVIGYLMEWKLTLPYWLTVVSATIAVGVAMTLPSVLGSANGALPGVSFAAMRASRPTLGQAFLHAIRSENLLLLMLQGVVLFVLARIVSVNLFQPILASKGFGLGAYGLVMGGMTLVEAVGAARPNWMRRWFSDVDSVSFLSGAMAISIAMIPLLGQTGTLVLFAIFSLVAGLSYPIQRQVMNDAIPDPEVRATLLSLESLIDRAVTALVAWSLESLSSHFSGFLAGSGMIAFAGAILIHYLLVRLRKREPIAPT